MRLAVILLFMVCASTATAQKGGYSDSAHYLHYMLGDWDKVIALGNDAKRQGISHYYVHTRSGYALYMKGRYMDAADEFRKAVRINAYPDFAQTWLLWSQLAAGMRSEAFVSRSKMPVSLRESIGAKNPKLFDGLSVTGGYRISTGDTLIGSTPVAALMLSHRFGSRLHLEHGVSYLSVPRFYGDAWQVSYLAQLGIQLHPKWSLRPAFTANHWNAERSAPDGSVTDSSFTEYGAALSLQWRTRRIALNAYGGYLQGGGADNDSLAQFGLANVLEQYFGGLTFSWYPLANLDLYTLSSVHYSHFLTRDAEWSAQQTIGGRIAKGTWLTGTYTWGRPMFHMMSHRATFSDNALEPLDHSGSAKLLLSPKGTWGVSLTYSIESRRIRVPSSETPVTFSDIAFLYHGIFAGFQLNL
jgi:hypothetical protein